MGPVFGVKCVKSGKWKMGNMEKQGTGRKENKKGGKKERRGLTHFISVFLRCVKSQ